MKIAYLSSPFLADCDLPLIREMHLLGHEIHYFLQMSDASRQATVINVKKMKPQGNLYDAAAFPELAWMEAYLPMHQIHVINYPKAHDWSPGGLKAVRKTFLFIKNGSFDVLHITSPLRYGAFLLYALPLKKIMTMHDPVPHSSDTSWLNRLHRRVAFRLVSHFILLSQSLVEEFSAKYRIPLSRIYTSRLGVYEILEQTPPAEMDLPEPFILFVGSINPHKGIRYLCEAFQRFHPAHLEWNLVIAGRGAFDFDIEKYVQTSPIRLFNRFVTDSELKTLISRSQMVVCPYIDATQSGVIMSAFALKKPVLATRVGALPEMMEHGRHGLLVEPADAEALAAGIEAMCEPQMLEEMKQHIESDFMGGQRSWKFIAQEHLGFYRQITAP